MGENTITRKELLEAIDSAIKPLKEEMKKITKKDNLSICFPVEIFYENLKKCLSGKIEDPSDIPFDMDSFIKFVSKCGFFKRGSLKEISDKRYQIQIEGCDRISECTHPRLNPENKVCPLALVAGAFLKFNYPNSHVIVEPSKFTPQDSITNIDIS